jgi:serine/threonine protein kinase/tetratricopeptide (TPR) repeat protein
VPDVNEQTLFAEALERTDPRDRAAFLDQACQGDPALRARIERLLAQHEHAGDFLEARPRVPAPTGAEPLTGTPGTVIGPYRLLEQVGEGGMGTVWMAQQTEPVKRLVALKLIKPGMDSRQVVARFEAERQALALMDHANIARVLDAGTTAAGRPFFVMDLVKGVPITRYCDEHRLTPRQRLELFLPVCQAVQHAHQKGVIHRDLKPSNVLVALYDGKPVPKVIDFGVAKAAGQQLTDKTLVTGFGAIVGTLEYMSPEQAEINQLDIDTRSDIYSLGVLLYELLTGSPPFTRKESEKGGVLEMLRVIREQEPTKPSAKLSTAEGLPALAANRGTEPAKLTRLVRGELDWIVLKALEKDRTRRYDTANGFALDVQRYLADEPVLACPPSAGYRFRKFARRNRGPVLAASLVFLALVVGVIGTAWGLIRAGHALREKEQERLAADASAERAVQAQARAEQGFAKAKDAVDVYLAAVTSDPNLKHKHDLQILRKKLLAAAVPFYQWFAEQQPGEAGLEAKRGAAYGRLGSVRHELGEKEAARKDYELMRTIFAQLVAAFPRVPEYREGLAGCHTNLGNLLAELEQRPAAEKAYRRALELFEELTAAFPTVPEYRQGLALCHTNLGNLLAALGQMPAAEKAHRRALELFEELAADFPAVPEYRLRLASTHNNLGVLLMDLGQQPAAERVHLRGVDLCEELVALFPEVPDHRQELANAHNSLGVLRAHLGQMPAAETAYRRALELQEELAATFPSVPTYRLDLAKSHNNLGRLLSDLGRLAEAEQACRRAVEIKEKLATDFATVPTYRQELGASLFNLSRLLIEVGQLPEGEKTCRRAADIRAKLAADYPALPAYRLELASTCNTLGVLLVDLGQRPAAEKVYRRALELLEELTAAFPTVPEYRQGLATNHRNRGVLLYKQGQLPAAEKPYRRAVELFEELAAAFPTVPVYRQELANTHNNLGLLLNALKQRPAAEKAYHRALELQENLATAFPGVPVYRLELAGSHNNLGNLLADLGQLPAAEKAYRKALDLWEELATAGFGTMPGCRRGLAGSYVNYSRALRDQGRAEASLPWYAKAIALLEPLVEQDPRLFTEEFYLRNAHHGRALALGTLGRHADAVKDWERVVGLNADTKMQAFFRYQRARSLARAGEHARAVAEVNALVKAEDLPGGSLYKLAGVCALASAAAKGADAPRLAEQYAARAVELLRQAAARGYKDAAGMKNDRDLDALRDRADWQKLLAELEAKSQSRRRPEPAAEGEQAPGAVLIAGQAPAVPAPLRRNCA